MSDLYLGVLLVIGAMTLIFFGPELGKAASKKLRHSHRRIARSRNAFRRALRIRTRKVNLTRTLVHS